MLEHLCLMSARLGEQCGKQNACVWCIARVVCGLSHILPDHKQQNSMQHGCKARCCLPSTAWCHSCSHGCRVGLHSTRPSPSNHKPGIPTNLHHAIITIAKNMQTRFSPAN